MNENIPYDLIASYLAGECTPKERERVEKWKELSSENTEIFEQLTRTWEETSTPDYSINVDNALTRVSERLGSQKKAFPTLRLAISAAAIIIISLGLFGILGRPQILNKEIVIATLTEASPMEYVLPDGSKVTMNKGSLLTYPKRFGKSERRISFSGEAYFDIVSDKSKPFIIVSGQTETKVLGTEFNLSNSLDSIVQIIVKEGLVSFKLVNNTQEGLLLEAGQVGEYFASKNQLEKRKNDDLNYLSWKSGRLVFINQEVGVALTQLSKHYSVDFKSTSPLDTVSFTATFDNQSIDEVVANMELILDTKIEKMGASYVFN